MNIIIPSTFQQTLLTATDQIPARIGHVNRVIEQLNLVQTQSVSLPQFASLPLIVSASTTINGFGNSFTNYYASSGLAAWTASFVSIPDGATITVDYLKTTAANLVITFPSGSLVSLGGDVTVSGGGLIATLISTITGRYTITILNMNGVYKIYVVKDVA